MKTLATLLIFFFCSIPALHASPKGIENAYLEGDDHKLFDEISKHLLNNALEAESILYLHDIYNLSDVGGYTKIKAISDQYLTLLSKSSKPIHKNMAYQATLLSAKFDLSQRKIDTHPFLENGSVVSKWKISDVYNKYGSFDLNYAFEPEFNPEYPYRAVKSLNKDATLSLDYYTYPYSRICYAETIIKAPAGTKLRVYSNAEYKLFVNRREILDNTLQNEKRNLRIIKLPDSDVYSIMLKFRNKEGAYFSVISTDKNDQALALSFTDKKAPSQSLAFEIEEVSKPVIEDAADSLFNLAWYYSILESKECFRYYEASLNTQYTTIVDAAYASDLLYLSAKGSSYYNEGLRRFSALVKANPTKQNFFYWKSRELANAGEYNRAINLLKATHSKDISSRLLLLTLYTKTDRIDDFRSELEASLKVFPHSKALLKRELDFLYRNNHPLYEEKAKLFTKKFYAPDAALQLAEYRYERGDAKALDLFFKSYSYRASNSFYFSQLRTLIREKEYEKASKLLLHKSTLSDHPTNLYYQGLIQKEQGGSADMYWQKIRSLYPWIQFASYYNAYKENNSFAELSAIRKLDKANSIIDEYKKGTQFTHTFPYKAHSYKILPYGYALFMHEELINITKDSDLSHYGEYRIAADKNLLILRARVYHRDGSFTDSFTHNKVRGSTYVTLNRVSKGSLVHILYQVLERSPLYGTQFYEQSYVPICGYDETVAQFDLHVSYPTSTPLSIHTSFDTPISKHTNKGITSASLSTSINEEIKKEHYNGPQELSIFSYAISTLESSADFFNWYRGHFPKKSRSKALITKEDLGLSGSSSVDELIRALVRYLNTTITTSGTLDFYPQSPVETLYFKKGSVEDKVFLCKEILDSFGIRSYPTLVKKEHLPANALLTKYSFDTVMLAVDTDSKQKLYIDFSSRYLPYKLIASQYENREALVIKPKQIAAINLNKADKSSTVHSLYSIAIKQQDCSFTAEKTFSGSDSQIRELFTDQRYHEYYLAKLSESYALSPLITDFSISDPDDFATDFTIRTSGRLSGYAIATDTLLVISPFIERSNLSNYTKEPKRTQTLFIDESITMDIEYQIELPFEYTNSTLNITMSAHFKDALANLSVAKKSGTTLLRCVQKVYVPKMAISADEYKDFQQFVIDINNYESKRITLSRE